MTGLSPSTVTPRPAACSWPSSTCAAIPTAIPSRFDSTAAGRSCSARSFYIRTPAAADPWGPGRCGHLARDSGEQERRERPEERADRSFCARQTEENHENTDERPLSNGRSDNPTARLPRARGALKDQVINRHGNTVRSLTEPGNALIGHCRSVTLAGNTMRCGRVRRGGYVFLWRS